MSGGSFNYLYCHEGERNSDLDEMAKALWEMGFNDLSEMTRAMIFKPSDELRQAWHAVEWWKSGDWSMRQAVADCEQAHRDLFHTVDPAL